MSEQATEPQVQGELPPQGVSDFTELMAIMAPEEGAAPAAAGSAEAGAAAGAEQAAAGTAAGAGAAAPPAPASDAPSATAGDSGGAGGSDAGVPAGGAAPGDGAAAGSAGKPDGSGPADGAGNPPIEGGATDANSGGAAPGDAAEGADPAQLVAKFGEISTTYETKVAGEYQVKALEEVRGENPKYFEALEQHPRLLVGQQVPRIGAEGMDTLRDEADAKSWQEAVKSILVQEVMDRAGRAMEENADTLNTVHASIELFQNNPDLIPNAKGFDKELADRFANLAQPYELRVDGKLHGWTVPVQPLIKQIRAQLVSERAAKAQAPAAPAAPEAGAAQAAGEGASTPPAPAAPGDQPQAGIQSKAGNSSETEDFSTLFGTIGLPNLRI